jgi:hypothetical protein
MSDMKKLLESMTRFSGEPAQKPGDQVRGTDQATHENPFKHRLVGENDEYCDACDRPVKKCVCDDDLKESLMQEYRFFVKEAPAVAANVAATSPTPAQTPPGGAPGPGGTAAPAVPGQTPPAAPGQAPKPGQPAPAGTAPAVPGQAPKPGQPAPAGTAPTGAAGTATPPVNPMQVKKDTDALTALLNNPAHPMNAQLQALIKKAGSIPK